MMKKLFSILLVLVLLLSLMPAAQAAGERSGSCGDGVYWRLEDGVLTISGEGGMKNYDFDALPPWYDLREEIKKIELQSGITYIGQYAFSGCNNCETVIISDGVIYIGNAAFRNCVSMSSVYIPGSVYQIRAFAFYRCQLTDIYYGGTKAQWENIDIQEDINYGNLPLYSPSVTKHFSETPYLYTISFDPQGGTVSPTSAKVGPDGTLSSLPIPTRSGYRFIKWTCSNYPNLNGNDTVTTSYVFKANNTVFAKWEKLTELTKVSFTSLTTTLASGSPATPSAALASGSHCSITYLGRWLERVSGDYYTGTAGQGMTYYYNLEFVPDEGHTFGDVGTKVPVYLNGTKLGDAEVEKRGSTVKLYFTVSYTVPVTGLPINEEYFPDYWFREYVKEYIDTEADGYLTDAERLAVTEIDINNCENQSYYWGIGSLEGISFFPNLEYLYCNSNLTTLDLSGNTKLVEVRLNNDDFSTGMTLLNVRGCAALESLSLYDQEIAYLDLTSNTKLKELNADGNELTSLDLSKNTLLESLYIGGNAGLINLDLSKNKELRSLAINNTGIKTIDLTSLSKLDYLRCDHCGMTALDLTKNAALTNLDCGYNALTALDLTKNAKLKILDCRFNKLTALDIGSCPALFRLNCVANKLSALNLSQNAALSELSCYGNEIKALAIYPCPKLLGAYTGSYHPERTEEINGETVAYIFYSASGGVLAVEKGVRIGTAPLIGDLNHNGVIDPVDAALLFRCVSGDTAAVDGPAPDLNADGNINNRDAILLFRMGAA